MFYPAQNISVKAPSNLVQIRTYNLIDLSVREYHENNIAHKKREISEKVEVYIPN